MRDFPRPRIEVEHTDYGLRLSTLRQISDQSMHVRTTNLVFPNAFMIPMSQEMTISQWHVPVDETTHYWYCIFTSFGSKVDKEEMRRQRLELYELPNYVPRKNKSNDYGFDPHEQAHETFTGMGADINIHDQWACELMGPVQDRTKEHLGQSDKAISAYRRMLRAAIEQAGKGERPLMVLEPAACTGHHRAGLCRWCRACYRLAGLYRVGARASPQDQKLGEWALAASSFRGARAAGEPGIQLIAPGLCGSGFRVRAFGAPRNDDHVLPRPRIPEFCRTP